MRENDIDRLERELFRHAARRVAPKAPPDFTARVMASARKRADARKRPWWSWDRLASPLYATGAAAAVALLAYAFLAQPRLPDALYLARLDPAWATLAAYRLN